MLMRLMSKGEYLIVPKGTKFKGSGKLGLILPSQNNSYSLRVKPPQKFHSQKRATFNETPKEWFFVKTTLKRIEMTQKNWSFHLSVLSKKTT